MTSPDRLRHKEEQYYLFLVLNRIDIPILQRGQPPQRHPDFRAPIHPRILDLPEKIRFDQQYAERVFSNSWAWTVKDVGGFIADPKNNVSGEEAGDLNRLKELGEEHWLSCLNFSLSQNLLLSAQCRPGDALVYPAEENIVIYCPTQVNFSMEKAKAYAFGGMAYEGEDGIFFYPQSQFFTKNLTGVFQVLLLRNWAIEYHNRLLKIALGLETPEPTPVL